MRADGLVPRKALRVPEQSRATLPDTRHMVRAAGAHGRTETSTIGGPIVPGLMQRRAVLFDD
jgi:hypothetical protein